MENSQVFIMNDSFSLSFSPSLFLFLASKISKTSSNEPVSSESVALITSRLDGFFHQFDSIRSIFIKLDGFCRYQMGDFEPKE